MRQYGRVANVHLVIGDNEFLAARQLEVLLKAARQREPNSEVARVEAGDIIAGEIPELLSPTLFAPARIVVLANLQDLTKHVAEALAAALPTMADNVALVAIHSGGAKGKPAVEALTSNGAREHRCPTVTKPRERLAFVRDEVIAAGGRLMPGAAEAIVEAVGSDLRELATVCEQLVADTGGTIDSDTVARYYRGRAEASGFAVADAVMAGDSSAALVALRWALAAGVDPVPISDALADGVRTVARVASAGRSNAYQVAGSLGLPPWKVEKAQRVARGWSAHNLSQALDVAAQANADVKGSSPDRAYALEKAVLAMTDLRGGPRG